MSFSYLFDPNKQFHGRDGNNLVGGILRVYLNGTDDHATTYKNFDGGLNENDIVLDNDGRAVVIVDSSRTYRLEVRDRSGDLLWTTTGLVPGGGYIDEGISNLNYNDEAEAHKFVKSVSEANGVISVQRGQPVIGDVAGLQTELDGKESTSNKKQSIDPTSTTEYPSSKAVADAITASRDTLKGINFYLEGESEPFAEYSPTANADTDVHIPVNVGNSAILEWDGTSRLYDQIEELVDAGKIVFIKTDRYYYTLIETTAAGRFCFVSMPTYYVVYYLEFYPSAHPTGFSETTWVNATIKFFNSSDSDETIWTGASGNARNLNVYEDTNKERYISGRFVGDTITFYNMNPDSQTLAYAFTRSGTYGNYTYSHTVIKAQQYPIVTYVKTSSEYNDPKAVRVALARLDNFAQTAENTPKAAEFEIICSTGDTTPNGNANSSFSMRVLVTAKQNGGPIKVDCRITGNNGWDMEAAMPTISAYDTNNSNGVVVFFGLMSSGIWQDFEQTYVTVVNMKPDVKTLGTIDSVKSYADPVWHPDTVSSLPSNMVGGMLNVNDVPIRTTDFSNAVVMGTIGPLTFKSFYYTKTNTYSTMYAFGAWNAFQSDTVHIEEAQARIVYPFREFNGAPSGSWYDSITQIGNISTGAHADMAFTCGYQESWETSVSENFYIEGWMRVTSALLGKTYTYKYTIDKDNTQGWIWFKIELIQVEDAT